MQEPLLGMASAPPPAVDTDKDDNRAGDKEDQDKVSTQADTHVMCHCVIYVKWKLGRVRMKWVGPVHAEEPLSLPEVPVFTRQSLLLLQLLLHLPLFVVSL